MKIIFQSKCFYRYWDFTKSKFGTKNSFEGYGKRHCWSRGKSWFN